MFINEVIIKRYTASKIGHFPNRIAKMFAIALNDLKFDSYPKSWHCAKMKGYDNRYRLKVTQNYRLLYEVIKEEPQNTIKIIDVGTRQDIY